MGLEFYFAFHRGRLAARSDGGGLGCFYFFHTFDISRFYFVVRFADFDCGAVFCRIHHADFENMKILSGKDIYIEQSGYRSALILERHLSRSRTGVFLWLAGVISLTGFFTTILLGDTKSSILWFAFGTAEVFFGFFLLLGLYWLFLVFLQNEHPANFEELQKSWEHESYGRILSFSAARLIDVGARGENFLLAQFWDYLLRHESFLWVWHRLDLPPEELGRKVKEQYPPAAALSLREVLLTAWQKVLAGNNLQITEADLLVAVFELDKIFQKLMFEFEIEEKDLREVADWRRRLDVSKMQRGEFWTRENLLDTKGIGKDWAAGYTINLDRVATDLTALVRIHKPPEHLYGRNNQVEILQRALVRSAGFGNVVLVGAPGVGRHTLLRAFAAKLNRGDVLGPLRYKRLLQIDSAAVIGGTKSLNEVLEHIRALFSEALSAENVILVINNFDAFLDPHPEAGRVNAAEALLPFLQSGLRVMGITTFQGYQATIGKNPQLERLMSKLELSEPSAAETLLILQDAAVPAEKRFGLWFTHESLHEIVALSEKLIQTLPNPEKSLEILEETAVFVVTKLGEKIVSAEHVRKVVSQRTKVPVEKVAAAEKDTLMNLETILHERIVGQQEAIEQLANALRRARSGIRSEKHPIGSFLFMGPTGVGKTETTKALAAVYFGSEQRIIRFDMSEFQEVHSINRLIGDADTNAGGLLTEAVLQNPFSLILFDELEKAHSKVLDLFLQVLDEGRLTDFLGRSVSFVNTMIIATSNAGAEEIRQMVKSGQNPAEARDQLLDSIQRQGIFRPEFLNRFDAVIIFRPLTEEELTQVAMLLLRELNVRLAQKDIKINITPELAATVARGGYSAEFGARPLRRYIQDRIENYIAKGLISGEIKRGQVVEIDPQLVN